MKLTTKNLMVILCALEVYLETVEEVTGISENLREEMKDEIIEVLTKIRA